MSNPATQRVGPVIAVPLLMVVLSIGLPSQLIAASAVRQAANRSERSSLLEQGEARLSQGDLKGAEYAFNKVTQAEPGYADGWLNVARALVQEGETDAAKPYIKKALEIDSSLGRIHYFKALIEKEVAG